MTNLHNLEAVFRTLCDLRQSALPFGGIIMLYLGNFLQILPFLRAANRSQIVSPCFKRSRFYFLLKLLHVFENIWLQSLREDPHAVQDALEFPDYILQLGEEKLQSEEKQPAQRPTSIKILRDSNEMTKNIFPNLQSIFRDEEWIAQRALLTTKNERIQDLNGDIGVMIPGSL